MPKNATVHLRSAITDERALVRLSSRDMHRHPPERAHEISLDALINPASHEFATDLIEPAKPSALLSSLEPADFNASRAPSLQRNLLHGFIIGEVSRRRPRAM